MSPRAMTRYVFEEVTYRASKTVACAGCGKTLRRQRTFMNTLNPWNVNEDGNPRTVTEIRAKLRAESLIWIDAPDYCTSCIRARVR